jgi:uncharacterized membrane protein YgcG
MPPLSVVLVVIVVIVVIVMLAVMLVIAVVVWLRVWLGIWCGRLRFWRLRFWRLRSRRLRSGRWGRVWPRLHIVTDEQGKPATAALRAFQRQRQDNAPLDVRRAGGEGENKEKVFHHSGPNRQSALNDRRYDFSSGSI